MILKGYSCRETHSYEKFKPLYLISEFCKYLFVNTYMYSMFKLGKPTCTCTYMYNCTCTFVYAQVQIRAENKVRMFKPLFDCCTFDAKFLTLELRCHAHFDMCTCVM